MTAKDLKDWADSLPPDAKVELMLAELAKAHGYTKYGDVANGGWVTIDGEHLRIVIEHPDRRPAQVAERLSR